MSGNKESAIKETKEAAPKKVETHEKEVQTKTATPMTFSEVLDDFHGVSPPAPAARPFTKEQHGKLFKEFHRRQFRKQKGMPEDSELELVRHRGTECIEQAHTSTSDVVSKLHVRAYPLIKRCT